MPPLRGTVSEQGLKGGLFWTLKSQTEEITIFWNVIVEFVLNDAQKYTAHQNIKCWMGRLINISNFRPSTN